MKTLEEDVKTLSSTRTEDFVELEHSMALFALFRGICDDQLPIVTSIFDDRLSPRLSRNEWSDPAIHSNITCTNMQKK